MSYRYFDFRDDTRTDAYARETCTNLDAIREQLARIANALEGKRAAAEVDRQEWMERHFTPDTIAELHAPVLHPDREGASEYDG